MFRSTQESSTDPAMSVILQDPTKALSIMLSLISYLDNVPRQKFLELPATGIG
jgi:hypothetical protein